MRPEVINSIWKYGRIVKLLCSVIAAVRVHATQFDLGVPVLSHLKIPELVIFTIPVVATCILLLHWLLRANARAYADEAPAARLPIAWFKPQDVDPTTLGGRIYVWAIFWVFAVLPIVGLSFIIARLIDGNVTYAANNEVFASGLAQFWPKAAAPLWLLLGDNLRFEQGPTYFAWVTPYGYLALWLACIYSALRLRRFYLPGCEVQGPSPQHLVGDVQKRMSRRRASDAK